jgi:predicted metal-dependent hydrolase
MQSSLSVTWPPAYVVKKHKRARHVKLRATKKNGLVVTTPWRFPEHDIRAILESHKDWILQQLNLLRAQETDLLPDEIRLHAANEYFCIRYLASTGKLSMMERPGQELVLFGDIANTGKVKAMLVRWLRERAAAFLSAKLQEVSFRIGLPFKKVTVRDQLTMWGSCTREKSISLSYRLIFLPWELVEHVMIHELSHTVHLNHSAKFWSLVAKYDTNWQDNRRNMRKTNQYIPSWI